jgi:serine phosphatase RsbU (regulator of sigma subunit)
MVAGKKIREYHFTLNAGDSIVLYSDGVVHAGVGKLLNMGWQRRRSSLFSPARSRKTARHPASPGSC